MSMFMDEYTRLEDELGWVIVTDYSWVPGEPRNWEEPGCAGYPDCHTFTLMVTGDPHEEGYPFTPLSPLLDDIITEIAANFEEDGEDDYGCDDREGY